ncbi:MAG: CapA family protein [Acidobacteriota bacterium]
MRTELGAPALAVLVAAAASPSPRVLPIFIADSHASSFYWLASQLDPEEPCTLVLFDAHSDGSAIFDSDAIRDQLREIGPGAARGALLDRWRDQGVVQCYDWIEPLMPAPVARVVWVPPGNLTPREAARLEEQAVALLDGHLEAAPRRAGSFGGRYVVSDLRHLTDRLGDDEPIAVTIDLDSFAGMDDVEEEETFGRIWRLVVERPGLRAVTFAISRSYQQSDEDAHRLLERALDASLSLATARIELEPFPSSAADRSVRARAYRAAGLPVPCYDVCGAPDSLHAKLLASRERILVTRDRVLWDECLRAWEQEAPRLHLEIVDAEPSTDGVWRVPSDADLEVSVVPDPWMATIQDVQWCALVPRYASCNVTRLGPDQVGFVAQAAPRPVWDEIPIAFSGTTLAGATIDALLGQPRYGSLRLRARARVDGRLRETPVMELRRFSGDGFRAAITEQFGLPYLFGSGELAIGADTGPETRLGADCANFVVYALRRQGLRVPWCDPKGLTRHLDARRRGAAPGEARIDAADIERGLIVHLGTHVAAVMEDRPPRGVLDAGDLVAHQLKGVPGTLTLGALLADRGRTTFDLLGVPERKDRTIVFGGDVMLGRTCGERIERGVDPFAAIAGVLRRASFAAANLECTICGTGAKRAAHPFTFRAPLRSAALLRDAGFRAVGLANNHALDFGSGALIESAAHLSLGGVEPVGVALEGGDSCAPRFFSLPGGGRLALLAICDVAIDADPPGVAVGAVAPIAIATDRAHLRAALERARDGADLVACMVHWGDENTAVVTERQRDLARFLVDHGADLVIGSHPHCLQPLDVYHGRPIAYSLGNLVFDGAPTVSSWNHGALLEVGITGDARVSSVHTIDVILADGFPEIDAREAALPAIRQERRLIVPGSGF